MLISFGQSGGTTTYERFGNTIIAGNSGNLLGLGGSLAGSEIHPVTNLTCKGGFIYFHQRRKVHPPISAASHLTQ